MSIALKDFYIFPEDIFRVGNATSHKLTAIRVGEVDVYDVEGVRMVIANGKGVSGFTLRGLRDEGLTGFAWLFPKGTMVEPGLKLVDDAKPDHYVLAPVTNMPLDRYKALLDVMGRKCSKHLKIKKDGTMERTA